MCLESILERCLIYLVIQVRRDKYEILQTITQYLHNNTLRRIKFVNLFSNILNQIQIFFMLPNHPQLELLFIAEAAYRRHQRVHSCTSVSASSGQRTGYFNN